MVRDVGHDELSNEDRAAPPESMRKLVEKPDGRGLARQLDDPLSLRAQFRTCFGLGGFIEGMEDVPPALCLHFWRRLLSGSAAFLVRRQVR